MRSLYTDERGVSPVVATLLLMSLFIGIYAIYMSVTIPGEFASKEKEHMSEVRDSFLRLQSAVQEMSAGESRSISVPMSANLVSGGFRGPSIGGRLVAVENSILYFEIQNAYYSPQAYVYDNGAVILFQSTENKSLMISPPTMINVVPYGAGENIRVSIQVIRLMNSSEVTSTGVETLTVLIKNENSWPDPIPDQPNAENVTIVVHSNYRDAWKDYLVNLVEQLRDDDIYATADFQNLQLTIHGKSLATEENDIYFVREFKDVSITLS